MVKNSCINIVSFLVFTKELKIQGDSLIILAALIESFSLFQILFTCIDVTIMQAYSNRTVDFVLALLLLIGSTTGAQVGTRLSKRLNGDQLKILLASLVLLVMVKMLVSLLLQPHILLSYYGGD